MQLADFKGKTPASMLVAMSDQMLAGVLPLKSASCTLQTPVGAQFWPCLTIQRQLEGLLPVFTPATGSPLP